MGSALVSIVGIVFFFGAWPTGWTCLGDSGGPNFFRGCVMLLPGSSDAGDTILARLDDALANAHDAIPGAPLAVSGATGIHGGSDADRRPSSTANVGRQLLMRARRCRLAPLPGR